MDDLQMPLFASLGGMLLVFCTFLIIFHLLCVWPRSSSKFEWKILDYVWLAITLLSLIGLTGTVRQNFATAVFDIARLRLETEASNLESSVRFGTY